MIFIFFLFLQLCSAVQVTTPPRGPTNRSELVGDEHDDDRLAIPHVDRGRLYGSADCQGCSVTVDVRCLHVPHWRHAFFHRIVDCLLPVYGLIKQAEMEGGNRCALTYFHEIDLEVFFSTIWSPLQFRLIDEHAPCASNLSYYAVDPGTLRTRNDPHAVQQLPINYAYNIEALHSDVIKYVQRAQPFEASKFQSKRPLIMVLRKGTRQFTPHAEDNLRMAIQENVTTYTGAEPFAETLAMWTYARGIVGYHGAGFANLMFTAQEACVAEISLWKDLEQRSPWRTNKRIVEFNPLLHWFVHNLGLKQMLKVNGAAEFNESTDINEVDRVIKDWKFVEIKRKDAAQIATYLLNCSSLNATAARLPGKNHS